MNDKKSGARAPAGARQPAPAGAPVRNEIKYYGMNACLALWRRRPQDVIRIYVQEDRIPQCKDMLKWAAQARKAYHVVALDDLERLTESLHHQGICILALEPPALDSGEFMRGVRGEPGTRRMVYLDGVENPHNLGAILRTCAHFGVRYILGQEGRLPRFSPAACRVAEGGAEWVRAVYLPDPMRDMAALQAQGYALIGSSVSQGSSLYEYPFPERVILVLGAETGGMSRDLQRMADAVLRIPGTGDVESLNVSVACGVLVGEVYRQGLAPRARARVPTRRKK